MYSAKATAGFSQLITSEKPMVDGGRASKTPEKSGSSESKDGAVIAGHNDKKLAPHSPRLLRHCWLTLAELKFPML